MATIKVKMRPSSVAGKAGTIYYQVTHMRVIRRITTHVRILPEQWDEERRQVASSAPGYAVMQANIDGGASRLLSIIHAFEKTGASYSVDDIVRRFRASGSNMTFCAFMREQIDSLRLCNRLGTSKNYEYTLMCFRRFIVDDIPVSAVTEPLIERFNAYLVQRGIVRNTISFYMRILRSVYNKAVRKGLAEQTFPFANVYTGIDRTRKRAVDEHIIARFIGLDLTRLPWLTLTRDLFLFSFCTRGMSFVDMAYLKRDNIRDGRIRYIRRKTGQEIEIRVEPEMRRIIERYADEARPYVFPILRSTLPEKAYREYRAAMSYHNKNLKRLCAVAGIPGLTFYSARHSWATAARNHRVPLSVISAGMGHTSERTTQIYLAMLENSVIDDANKGIIEALRCTNS